MPATRDPTKNGYEKAVDLLTACTTDHGFLASTTRHANYRRVWSRDGVVVGLAALLTGDERLISCFRRTLETLAEYQGPHGEIPSNVDPVTDRVSYGGTAGRVDGGLWPMVNGFYVADLARRGQAQRARVFLNGIHRANAMVMDGEPWGFPEYVHGKTWEPGGTPHQAWSAAGAIIAERTLAGEQLLRLDGGGPHRESI